MEVDNKEDGKRKMKNNNKNTVPMIYGYFQVDQSETRSTEPDGQVSNVVHGLIDWYDPWFRYLLLFHILCCLMTILITIKKIPILQFAYFGLLLMMVFFSENLNEWAAQNYKLFSKQQYFDSNGLFISTVFSTPILINCLVMVIMWLLNMSKLMSEVRYVKHRSRKKPDTDSSNPDNRTDNEGKKEK